jgi:hypothetical protein
MPILNKKLTGHCKLQKHTRHDAVIRMRRNEELDCPDSMQRPTVALVDQRECRICQTHRPSSRWRRVDIMPALREFPLGLMAHATSTARTLQHNETAGVFFERSKAYE